MNGSNRVRARSSRRTIMTNINSVKKVFLDLMNTITVNVGGGIEQDERNVQIDASPNTCYPPFGKIFRLGNS